MESLFQCIFIWQISQKYGLIYVITKLGLLFVYDMETAAAVYRNRISPDPIFLTAEASSLGGFYAVNRKGQVLLASVNEATLVPFVSGQVSMTVGISLVCSFDCHKFALRNRLLFQLNNLELAVNLAKRGNLPGAENLVRYLSGLLVLISWTFHVGHDNCVVSCEYVNVINHVFVIS